MSAAAATQTAAAWPLPADPIGQGRAGAMRSVLWPVVRATFFRWSLQNAYKFRARLLTWFGATLDTEARVRPTVRIDRPWMLTMGRKSSIGDGCEVWAGAPVTIGARSVLSQYTLVNTWRVDPQHTESAPEPLPIMIGDDAWVATESVLVAGSVVPDGVVVGARSVIRDGLEPWTIATGSPARSRRTRPPWKSLPSEEAGPNG